MAFGVVGAVGLALIALLVFNLAQPAAELEGVEHPIDRGSGHLAEGETTNYGTATPTSGPHSPTSARCGLYPDPLPLVFAVHDLEHGVVVIWYRPDLESELLPDLRAFINEWDSHVIVSPNPGISDPIVATAWNRLMRFDTVEPRLSEFADTYRNRGPESVPCDIEEL
jgi:hypothetical protein